MPSEHELAAKFGSTTCSPSYNTNCFNNIAPWPDGPANDHNVRNDNTGFFDDFVRTYQQKAAFMSVDFDITSYFGHCQNPYGTDLSRQDPNHLHANGFKNRGGRGVAEDHCIVTFVLARATAQAKRSAKTLRRSSLR